MTLRVTLYHAAGCHLCERAREVLLRVQAERAFELVERDISGDPGLERRYRELLPVVEVAGGRRFVYFLPEDAFERALDDAQTSRLEGTL